jgi:eukaryotic-like serine/threonine-protein kinase
MGSISPGSRFGPYEVNGILGSGGMGEVYLARDTRLGRQVALKVLPTGLASDPDRLRRFEHEARTSGLLNHPNIVTVFDVGTQDGQPYLVCELLEGETLRDRLRRGPIAPREATVIAVQVARGLAAAHAKGVVHRDLKPENLILTRDGSAKLLDFGIAKLLQPETGSHDAQETLQVTSAGVVMGTVAYMSPEQVAGRTVDHRSDIFSFGAVLYEVLSGVRPFVAETPAETMTAILRQEPEPLPSLAPNASPALDRIVAHCLEKAPEDRFQTARDLAFALDALTGTRPATHGEPVPPPRVPTAHAGWWRPATLAGVPLALAGGFALAWSLGRTPHAAPTPTFSRVTRLIATDANESAPALSPDSKWIAYLAATGGRADVCVRFVSGGQTVNLTAGMTDISVAPRRDIGGLDISPDGTLIVFDAGPPAAIASQQSSYVIPAPLGGTPRKLVTRGLAVRWSPDGQRIAYMVPGGSAGDSLWVADASGEHPRELLPVSGGIHAHWPAWSADGQYVFFHRGVNSSGLEPTEIWRVPVAGGPPERVIATSRRAVHPFPSLDGRGLLYSSNPNSVELSLWWKPTGQSPVRVTTGVGEYAEARLAPDGRSMIATAYTLRQSLATMPVDGDAATLTPLTPEATGDIDPDRSPKGDRIALSSTRGGDRNIWTARPDGTDPRIVTAGTAIDERPAWSPDGTRIAFVSSRGGQRSLWVTDADGGIPRHVCNAQVLDTVTWSPDGSTLVYAAPSGRVQALFIVPATGGVPRRIPTPAGATAPSWSPSRDVIAYIAPQLTVGAATLRAKVAFVTASGDVPHPPLTHGPSLANGSLAWSPDGRMLAGIMDSGGAAADVWVIPVDGPARRAAQLSADKRPRGVTWAPDGKRLIIGLVERAADIVLFDQGR